jgi:hypothetical protein
VGISLSITIIYEDVMLKFERKAGKLWLAPYRAVRDCQEEALCCIVFFFGRDRRQHSLKNNQHVFLSAYHLSFQNEASGSVNSIGE